MGRKLVGAGRKEEQRAALVATYRAFSFKRKGVLGVGDGGVINTACVYTTELFNLEQKTSCTFYSNEMTVRKL